MTVAVSQRQLQCTCARVCVFVCVRERERESHARVRVQRGYATDSAGVFTWLHWAHTTPGLCYCSGEALAKGLIKTIMGRPVTILRAGEATGGKQGTCAVTNPIVSYSPGEAYTFKIKQDGMALFGASSGEVVSSRLGNTFTAGAGCPASTKNPRVGTFCQDNVKSNTYFEVRSLQRRACSRAAVIDADSSGHARQCASRSQVSIVVTHVDV